MVLALMESFFSFFSILTRIRMTYFFWVIVGVFMSGFLSHFSVLAHVHVDSFRSCFVVGASVSGGIFSFVLLLFSLVVLYMLTNVLYSG